MGAKPKVTVSFFEKDLGLGKIMRESAKIRKKPYVKVGVIQSRGSKLRPDGKKTVADIAQIHEYGAPGKNIPERSFIRSTVNKNQDKYDHALEKFRDEIFDGSSEMTVEMAFRLLGQRISSDMKATIRAGIPPGLKESTIRAKNAGEISKAKSHLNGSPSSKDFTKAGAKRNAKALDLVSTGGSSTPLIDTGQLINAISYEVVEEGGQERGEEGEHE